MLFRNMDSTIEKGRWSSVLGVAAFARIVTNPRAGRFCRHACPNFLVLNGDENSLATAVLSMRSNHLYVQWMVIDAGCSIFLKEVCHCSNLLAQLHHKWPSVHCVSLLENSIIFSRHDRECSFAELEAAPARFNAPSVCPVEHERLVSVLASCALGLGVSTRLFPRESQSPPTKTRNGDLCTL